MGSKGFRPLSRGGICDSEVEIDASDCEILILAIGNLKMGWEESSEWSELEDRIDMLTRGATNGFQNFSERRGKIFFNLSSNPYILSYTENSRKQVSFNHSSSLKKFTG